MGVALRRVFDLEFSEIHLIEIILKVSVINRQCVINESIFEGEVRCCLCLAESKDRMDSASYEYMYMYRHMSARKGTQFVLLECLLSSGNLSREDHENIVD